MSSSDGGDNNNSSNTGNDLQGIFERQLFEKIGNVIAARDAAEVVTVHGKTAVFCGGGIVGGAGGSMNLNASGMSATNITGLPGGPNNLAGVAQQQMVGGDVRVVVVGPSEESELVLASLCEALYDALSKLMGGLTDRVMVLDNLELVLLLIDEHCDGGLVLEADPNKLVGSVLLRDGAEVEGMPNSESYGGSGYPNSSAQQDGSGNVGHGMNMHSLNSNNEMSIAQAFYQAKEQLMTGLAQTH